VSTLSGEGREMGVVKREIFIEFRYLGSVGGEPLKKVCFCTSSVYKNKLTQIVCWYC